MGDGRLVCLKDLFSSGGAYPHSLQRVEREMMGVGTLVILPAFRSKKKKRERDQLVIPSRPIQLDR